MLLHGWRPIFVHALSRVFLERKIIFPHAYDKNSKKNKKIKNRQKSLRLLPTFETGYACKTASFVALKTHKRWVYL